jgi:hypothetical protein
MSFRDIGYILKNVGLSHGITNTEDTIITNLLIINNSHNLIGSITRKRTCRGGCRVRSFPKGSNQILHRVLEAKTPVQTTFYLQRIKRQSFCSCKAI